MRKLNIKIGLVFSVFLSLYAAFIAYAVCDYITLKDTGIMVGIAFLVSAVISLIIPVLTAVTHFDMLLGIKEEWLNTKCVNAFVIDLMYIPFIVIAFCLFVIFGTNHLQEMTSSADVTVYTGMFAGIRNFLQTNHFRYVIKPLLFSELIGAPLFIVIVFSAVKKRFTKNVSITEYI